MARGPEADLVPALSRPSTVTQSVWERRWSWRIATQPIVHGAIGRRALHLVARAPKLGPVRVVNQWSVATSRALAVKWSLKIVYQQSAQVNLQNLHKPTL